jgi:hypothetical protein
MQPLPSARSRGDAPDAIAKRFVSRRHFGKAGQKGAQIEKRSADEDRYAATPCDLFADVRRSTRVLCGVEFRVGIEDVVEMMRDARSGLRGRFGAADVESAVGLDGIVVDDLAAGSFGEPQSEIGLPCSGWSGNHYDWH